MLFEWDDEKNAGNIVKHGIDFKDAIAIFDGPTVEAVDARSDEERWIAIGLMRSMIVAVVVYTDRDERRRIISARKATGSEEIQYYQAIFG
jgi:hypothetical protein